MALALGAPNPVNPPPPASERPSLVLGWMCVHGPELRVGRDTPPLQAPQPTPMGNSSHHRLPYAVQCAPGAFAGLSVQLLEWRILCSLVVNEERGFALHLRLFEKKRARD